MWKCLGSRNSRPGIQGPLLFPCVGAFMLGRDICGQHFISVLALSARMITKRGWFDFFAQRRNVLLESNVGG